MYLENFEFHLSLVLKCIIIINRTHYANTITKQKDIVMRTMKQVHAFRNSLIVMKAHIHKSPFCSETRLSFVLKIKGESVSINFEQQMTTFYL